jgi:tryptophan synthase alpha chain
VSARLERRFASLREEGRAGLVAFITAGDPDKERSLELLRGLPSAGADIIEIGLPSKNPWLDGPVIKGAHQRAVAAGGDAHLALELVRAFRETNQGTPVVAMGYADTLHRHTLNRFFNDAAEAGVDAALIVDATGDDWRAWREQARNHGIPLIPIAQAEDDELGWMRDTFEADGFVYAVASPGKSGGAAPDVAEVSARLRRLRRVTDLPVVCGFGIRSVETAQALGQEADGLAVGTAIAELLAPGAKSGQASISDALRFVEEIAGAIRQSGDRTAA